jgi:hypothetical protein
LQLFEELRYFLCTDIEQYSALAFDLDRVQRRLDTCGHATERLEAATFSCLALVGGTIG